jgi:hypothetical protein
MLDKLIEEGRLLHRRTLVNVPPKWPNCKAGLLLKLPIFYPAPKEHLTVPFFHKFKGELSAIYGST